MASSCDSGPPAGESSTRKRKHSYCSEPAATKPDSTGFDDNNNVENLKQIVFMQQNVADTEPIIYSRKGIIPVELQSRFESMRAGENFGLRHAQLDPKLQIIFQGQRFQFYSFWPNETSWWRCVHHRLQGCRAMVEIDAEMARVTMQKEQHRHHPVAEKLLECPQGKGVTVFDGDVKTFWLTHGAGNGLSGQFSRNLIIEGQKFYLVKIYKSYISTWHCNKTSSCRAHLSVQGVFQKIKQFDEHNHGPLSEGKMAALLANFNVELDLISIRDKKAQPPDVKPVIARITYDGQEFRLQSNEPDGTRLWRCMWHDLRQCPVTVRMSNSGMKVVPVSPKARHNHPDDIISVYLHEDDRHPVSTAGKDETTLLAITHEMKRRGMIYQGYKYLLATIGDRGDSEWKCVKCETTLQITGLFWIASQQGNHSHGPLTTEEIYAITRKGDNINDLLPSSGVPLSKQALLATLSSPNPNRTFQLHHQGDAMKILQDGFEYYYVCSKPSYSLWRCIYSSIRCCNATLRLLNITQQTSHTPHNHSDELWHLYFTALGQHTIQGLPFHFLIQPTFLRPLPHLIYAGHLFNLDFITEQGSASLWFCADPGCRVALTVTGQFETVSVEGLPHGEPPMARNVQADWIRRFGSSRSF
ncbi:conserved hypothetical protein [Culex quinquefasciatus]|uniref:FLYWCH-type domain-containing protein n=1 Tax=Culex quinquefasciatus TaxID=7176 RepID=B0WRI6_CULQU|nr:conserved hypothetical protein [Culex quinquefasciatus]|eukprot:XP_001851320.1 conserved hypothetical protein [Culex quinquefasciatus]